MHIRPFILLILLPVAFNSPAFAVESSAGFAFIENKGQMRDMDHRPVPFVLYRAQAPSMNVYLTETGLTYALTRVSPAERTIAERSRLNGFRSHDAPRPKRTVEQSWAHVSFPGGHIDRANLVAEEVSTEQYNYFVSGGRAPVLNVRGYGKITVRDLYPGIDWVLHADEQEGFKYDFIVHPGADASVLKLEFDAMAGVELTADGRLRIPTSLGTIMESAPFSYRSTDRRELPNAFVLSRLDEHRTQITFTIAAVDPTHSRVIDPQITWNTLMSCEQLDGAFSICTNSIGDVITTGYDGGGTGFPVPVTSGTYSGGWALGSGAFDIGCYIRAFDVNGVLRWSTFYEGAFFSQVITDANDRIIVVGSADSTFSTQPGTGTFSGAYFQAAPASAEITDMVIVGFSPGGAREWATFLGGTAGRSVTTDASGNFLIAGNALAGDVAVQAGTGPFAGAFQQNAPTGAEEMVLFALSPSGTKLWATYFGGTGDDVTGHITRRADGRFFISGITNSGDLPTQAQGAMSGAYVDANYGSPLDGFVLGLAPNGALEWCTYLGGDGEDGTNGIACDAQGRIVIMGLTQSPDLPLQNGAGSFAGAYQDNVLEPGGQDAFIAAFSNTGAKEWTSYLGGNNQESNGPTWSPSFAAMEQIGVDNCGKIIAVFTTSSPDLPATQPGCNATVDGALADAFVPEDVFLMRFLPNGSLNYSTYIGGEGAEFRPPFTIHPTTNVIHITGETFDQESLGGFAFINPGGGAYFDDEPALPLSDDAFMLRLSPTACDACNVLALGVQVEALACYGDCDGTATITTAQGAAPFTYAWSNGATTPTVTGLCAGTYTVDVTDANGLSATLVFELVQPPSATYPLSSTTSDCTAGTGTATITLPGAGYTVLWSDGQTQNTATDLAPGEYTVAVTAPDGCTTTDTVVVSGISTPVATALASPSTITAGESTQLVGLGGNTFVWSPTEGLSCTACASPTATPSDTTLYCVTVFDANNCSDTACVRVDVLRPCTVFVPNAFSPNASGKNDRQCVYGACISTMVFSIYDRWGNKVFESFDPKVCWDGLHNGEPLNPGVFVYHLSATLTNGETVERQGNITLVR